jgi:hypothetical protein
VTAGEGLGVGLGDKTGEGSACETVWKDASAIPIAKLAFMKRIDCTGGKILSLTVLVKFHRRFDLKSIK